MNAVHQMQKLVKEQTERIASLMDENRRVHELLQDACSHMADCECQCMDYRAIRQIASAPPELINLIRGLTHEDT